MNFGYSYNKAIDDGHNTQRTSELLFGFFVNGMFVAMGAELLEFHPSSGVAAVFLGRVSGHAVRPLVRVGATLSTFEGHNNANALSHSCTRLVILAVGSKISEF